MTKSKGQKNVKAQNPKQKTEFPPQALNAAIDKGFLSLRFDLALEF
jgi:hypothetical protein